MNPTHLKLGCESVDSCTATTLQTTLAQNSKYTEPDKINTNVQLVLVQLLRTKNEVVGTLYCIYDTDN